VNTGQMLLLPRVPRVEEHKASYILHRGLSQTETDP